MPRLSFFTLTLLCALCLLPSAISIQCEEEQYKWPHENPRQCCKKCPPGHYMTQDPDTSCHNDCRPCEGERYMESYNVKIYCDVCDFCSEPNMERKTNCTTTHNSVCGCRAGYQCKDHACTMCERIPTTTPTPAPPTTGVSSQGKTMSKDSVWFLVITALLCAGILLVVATRIRPFLHWIKFRHQFLPEKAPVARPLCQADGEVSKPVQEAGVKCDQLTDLCVEA